MQFIRHVTSLVSCATRNWVDDNASNAGASLAFYCAFSLAPLLIILLTIAGFFVDANSAQQQIAVQLDQLFGAATTKVLMSAVQSSQETKGLVATSVSVVTLLIGATSVLAALEGALEQIWGVEEKVPTGIRGWIRTRLLSLGVILALGFLLLVSLTISTAESAVRKAMALRYGEVLVIIGVADFFISLALVAGIFALIYRYLPAKQLPWRTVIAGGLLTGVLFDLGHWAIGIYLAHSSQPSAFGAAASFAALLLWLYYTAQIFLFGAEFTACLGGLRAADGDTAASPA